MFNLIQTGYISYFLIGINVIFTYIAWKRPAFQDALISTGPSIIGKKQWYRTLSSSLLHLDWAHLFWNMFALYNFGPILEDQFHTYFGSYWLISFGVFYFSTAVLSDLPSIIKHKNDDEDSDWVAFYEPEKFLIGGAGYQSGPSCSQPVFKWDSNPAGDANLADVSFEYQIWTYKQEI